MKYEIEYSYISHIGNIRKKNQDNFVCNGIYMNSPDFENLETSGGRAKAGSALFGVFDGMGGEECGEMAAYIAAKETADINKSDINKIDGAVSVLTEYCDRTNKKICDYAKSNGISSMGTTAALLLFSESEITLCNIGDSKVFCYSGGELSQISEDHVETSAYGSKPPLSQNLGIPPEYSHIEPYLSQGGYKKGDKYLICSDGLTDMLDPETIKRIIAEGELDSAVTELARAALEKGGRDNITLILLEVKQSKSKLRELFGRE